MVPASWTRWLAASATVAKRCCSILDRLADDGAMTWFEFACRIAAACEFPAERIVASRGADLYGPAKPPLNRALASTRAKIMPSLEAAIAAFAAHADVARCQYGEPTCASS
jgi:dTDP-4-dehydrorhamnose reductase